ncbi:ribosomal protein S18-alanine N-acetyltransferase [Marinobacter sp. S0848L]|uniref:ribosomal protein S18-alanine N-acetyltransferase n=1 Tax=Marinobacter sp. S0848L TaxID=2926423 RepID=UPI001FF6CB5D|nr:ribosomal protein S18-alanine N-acetyltransferase [Marinobacter sp. S0848L]MCK0106204.1 ribosomal protein S18-alanine N-acetyltransferase [Marinobacter sp. S0848L]
MKGEQATVSIEAAQSGIRPLTQDDLPRVIELERLGHSHPWTEGIFRDCFKDSYRAWGYVSENELVGYAIISYQFDEAHLLNVCVHPGFRGKGLGRELLRRAIAVAIEDDLACMILEVRKSNRAATLLYRSEGFQQIGVRPKYYPGPSGGEDARVMELQFT